MTFGGMIGLLIGVCAGGIVGMLFGAALTDSYWKKRIEHIADGIRGLADAPYEIEKINKEEKHE